MNQSELIVAHIFMAVFRTICTLVQPWGPILILILIELELTPCLNCAAAGQAANALQLA